ncbi:MAG: XdhC family protein [Acidimicrobiia bacterium]|nr:XdhC family protein [Acidimicrobiia bacterium]
MIEVLHDIERWHRAGHRVALARVVETAGSAPRIPGATMAVNDEGEVAGSVSGGCIEGAVLEEALAVLAGDRGQGLLTFGYADDAAFEVGVTCGGTIKIFVAPIHASDELGVALFHGLADALRGGSPIALATLVEGSPTGARLLVPPDRQPMGSLGHPDLDRAAARDALGQLAAGGTTVRRYGQRGEARGAAVTVFLEAFTPPPRMVISGAVDFTAALARAAKLLGFHVTVCDARPAFATAARFPMADEVVVDWPDRYLTSIADHLGPRDAVCVLTHDHKFDVPAIVTACRTAVGYLGAMGSRRTHEQRIERLREAGLQDRDIERLHAPIGLDLGARTPEETAIAICAEIIALRTGRPGGRLRDGDGPIHG